MKKIKFMTIFFSFFVLCGCTQSEVDDSVETDDEFQTDDGYLFEFDDIEFGIDDTLDLTVDLISEEPDCFEAVSCAYVGSDYIYTYDNFVLTFYEEENSQYLYLITLTSDLVSTQEGIVIGSSSEDVLSAYDDATSESGTLISYETETMELRFILVNDAVVSIEYYKLFD